MNQSQSQINSLLIIVALLAVVGGLVIVLITSPQSWELGPAAWLQGPPPTLTPVPASATPAPTGTATEVTPTGAATDLATATVPPPIASPTVDLTATVVVTSTDTSGVPTATPAPPSPGPVVTSLTLPDDVFALAVVTLAPGASSGRLREAPNSSATILTAVPNGTNLEVLFGRIEAEGNMWVQVRLANGTEGWMAEFLLRYTVQRP